MTSDLLGKIINFVILFGGLFYLLRRPLTGYLTKRSADIRASLDEARAGRDEAERKLAETRLRLAALREETAKITSAAEIESRKAQDEIRALAAREAERIKDITKQEIDLQLKAGVRELAEFTVDLAALLAERRLRADLDDTAQRSLIDRSIERLTDIHEKSSSH